MRPKRLIVEGSSLETQNDELSATIKQNLVGEVGLEPTRFFMIPGF